MTRQETVIKITKITRIVGEMKSQLDLDDEIEFEALDSSWMNIGKWAKEICLYMEQAPSPLLANLITNNEFTVPVVNYVQSHRQEIDSASFLFFFQFFTPVFFINQICQIGDL